jgi:sulfane dehydrogenase subunit SoxC
MEMTDMDNEAENQHKEPLLNKKISRRFLLGGAATTAIIAMQSSLGKWIQVVAQQPLLKVDDPTKKIGPGPSAVGKRSAFEHPVRIKSDTSSRTPLQDLYSSLTPSDLHYERHHAGVPVIDPDK